MVFRLASQKDIGVIASLRLAMLRDYAKSLPDGLQEAVCHYLKKHIADQSCLCALGEEEGKILSMAMLCSYEEIPDEVNRKGKWAKLCSVYTVPEARGKGYMAKLLPYLLDKAKQAGIQTITASADKNAIPLYERAGFQRASTMLYIDL